MPPADSAALIVARFLKANHYSESYAAFIAEAGLPDSAGTVSREDLTLETLLEEKRTFDVALRFEKLGVGGEGEKGWAVSAPGKGEVVKSLPTRSNILSTTIAALATGDSDDTIHDVLIATTADRRLHILSLPSLTLHASYTSLSDSPILSCTPLSRYILLGTTMSGALFAMDTSGNIMDKRADHSKYVVASAVFHPPRGSSLDTLVATAGWDNKVHIYRTSSLDTSAGFSFKKPVATISLPTKPESIIFITHPGTNEPVLLLSRTDSSFLHYYSIPTTTTKDATRLGKQNLAPHSNAWVAFTPSSLALHPSDPTLLAVGTNSIPHMKVLIVRLLIPAVHPSAPSPQGSPLLASEAAPQQETQASQARAALALADRESAAIIVHANTTAPQTAYSTPCVAWRPDGSGVWVNGDDGVVRGVEAGTGKVIAALGEGEGGHEGGSKVRCLAAGVVRAGDGDGDGEGVEEEVMVSGGFDQRVVVWRRGEA